MFRRELRIDPVVVQQLKPTAPDARFEGLGYSACGTLLGVATSETNETLLFRRRDDGRFENTPFCTLSNLKYPHDISFAPSGPLDGVIAIAQREGAVSLFAPGSGNSYGPSPSFDITGPQSRLEFSDAVAFVPPDSAYLAACNLSSSTVSFFKRLSYSPVSFETSPSFELKHPGIQHPDGLGFSKDGRWLAIANHGANTVIVFERNSSMASGHPLYGPNPVAQIEDDDLRYPHSVAFTDDDHLVMTNAGANYLKAYRLRRKLLSSGLKAAPAAKMIVNDQATFDEVNSQNKMEGGPKGVAIHGNELAVCSPEFGIKIYRMSVR